ncbi:MAG: hypothetical protein GY845_25605 [Planctomycetes bacterium]|nr:hypothetical protein [Planctomycetota bacterium]
MARYEEPLRTDAAADSLITPNGRIIVEEKLEGEFAPISPAADLELFTPVGFDSNVNKYAEWLAPDPTEAATDMDGSTGGTWTITVNDMTTASIAYNATVDVIDAELKAIGYDTTTVLVSGATEVYTTTFDGDPEITTLPTVTTTLGSLTGGTTPATVVTAGTATDGLHNIKGFVYPEVISLHATLDVPGVFMSKGTISYLDILETQDSGDLTALQVYLKDGLVADGLIIADLVGRH